MTSSPEHDTPPANLTDQVAELLYQMRAYAEDPNTGLAGGLAAGFRDAGYVETDAVRAAEADEAIANDESAKIWIGVDNGALMQQTGLRLSTRGALKPFVTDGPALVASLAEEPSSEELKVKLINGLTWLFRGSLQSAATVGSQMHDSRTLGGFMDDNVIDQAEIESVNQIMPVASWLTSRLDALLTTLPEEREGVLDNPGLIASHLRSVAELVLGDRNQVDKDNLEVWGTAVDTGILLEYRPFVQPYALLQRGMEWEITVDSLFGLVPGARLAAHLRTSLATRLTHVEDYARDQLARSEGSADALRADIAAYTRIREKLGLPPYTGSSSDR